MSHPGTAPCSSVSEISIRHVAFASVARLCIRQVSRFATRFRTTNVVRKTEKSETVLRGFRMGRFLRGLRARSVAKRASVALAMGYIGLCCATAQPENPAASAESTEASDRVWPSIPDSSFLDNETKAVWKHWSEVAPWLSTEFIKCGPYEGSTNIPAIRKCQADAFYKTPMYQHLRSRYPVTITSQNIGGISTEIFLPTQGVSSQNSLRVLVNLHGGGFRDGARTLSQLESIPIASVGRIKVISVDYRMMPEHAFPAASQDVEAVYRALIRTYSPKNIGIYGCSAGGVLTAQSIAWFQSKNLPLPGAIGMFCGAGSYWSEGDSGNFTRLIEERPKSLEDDIYYSYFEHADHNDPLAYPVRSPSVMARFPPSLLLTSTRDFALSSVVYTHTVLVEQNVPAELHVWEGLPHGFLMDPDLRQSQEAYDIIAKFFERYLGTE